MENNYTIKKKGKVSKCIRLDLDYYIIKDAAVEVIVQYQIENPSFDFDNLTVEKFEEIARVQIRKYGEMGLPKERIHWQSYHLKCRLVEKWVQEKLHLF